MNAGLDGDTWSIVPCNSHSCVLPLPWRRHHLLLHLHAVEVCRHHELRLEVSLHLPLLQREAGHHLQLRLEASLLQLEASLHLQLRHYHWHIAIPTHICRN